MNLLHLLDTIAQVDTYAAGRTDSRRAVFGRLLDAGRRVGTAAAPVLLTSVVNAAHARTQRTQATVVDALQYLLTVKQLGAAFYQGVTSPGLAFPPDTRQALDHIALDEAGHVQGLTTALVALGGTPGPPSIYQFNRFYTDVFSNGLTFLAVAQAIEDLSVRAFKGAAPDLKPVPAMLEFALNIHSIDARHASHIRRLRGEQAWIVGSSTTVPGPVNSLYQAGNPATLFPGEANTSQGGLTAPYAGNNIPVTRYAEAFDEPLDSAWVLTTINALFL